MPPETKYARSGDLSIAYQEFGEGPDLVIAPGLVTHVEITWEEPRLARFLEGLARFSRVLLFDKRGTGMSDPMQGAPSLEERSDDVRAVMDAAGSERAAVFGYSEGGAIAAMFAATHPDRATGLILAGSFARIKPDPPDYPFGWNDEFFAAIYESIDQRWPDTELVRLVNPTVGDDDRYKEWAGRFFRMSVSPGMAKALFRVNEEIDLRPILPAISAPTLVLHSQETWVDPRHGRYLAEHIAGARLVELSSQNHWPWISDSELALEEIEELVTGARHAPEPDRILATVLFTDIVGSTEKATELGDARWRELLDAHDSAVRSQLDRFGGQELKTMGDGFLATFDGPARGIRCASAIGEATRRLGVEVRAGLHTGECERMNGDLGGIAVHIGARVSAKAGPGEILVSSTVKDLVAGSGIEFADRGEEKLKGIPGSWRLFAVESA